MTVIKSKNINKSFLKFCFLLWFRIWIFVPIWMSRTVVTICAITLWSTSFTSSVTIAIFFCTIRFTTITKIILETYVWNISFFTKCKWIFLNDLINCLRSVHIVMIIFTTVTKTCLWNKIYWYLITHFTDSKTSTVHFQTLTFSTITSCIFYLFIHAWRKKSSSKWKSTVQLQIDVKGLFSIVSFGQSMLMSSFA